MNSTMAMVLNTVSENELQTVRIRASEPGPLIDVPEMLRFRDLLWTLAERDLRVRYKQTALGVIWVVLQPLMAALIFAFVFGFLAGLPSDDEPYVVFAFAGMTAWNTFSNVLSRVSGSLVSNAQMLSKIYFPRLILPLSSVVSALVDSVFSLGLMFVMMAIYRVWPGWGIVLLPVWLLILVVLSLGLGLMAASMMVRYRDVAHIIPVALQLGLYISPVAWSMTNPNLSEKFRWILRLNPLSSLLEAFRWSLFGRAAPPLAAIAYSIVVAAAVLWMGMMVFKQQERSFADVI
jgi:lipopolysaccharide transport system permease protein